MAEETEVVSAKALYEKLATDRDPYLKRARRAAELTVPYLMPKEGSSGSTDYEEPSQSLGARGLRNLASKLQIALFPINTPFFKNSVDEIALEVLTQGQDGQRGEIEKALSAREMATLQEMNSSLFRPVSFEACRQLVNSGNYLLYVPKKGRVQGFRLDSYVVNRDPAGNLLDCILKQTIARIALPKDIAAEVNAQAADKAVDRDATVDVYTHVTLNAENGNYDIFQEVDGVRLTSGEFTGSYPADKLPWTPLRFTYVEGEDYGRGFIDEYIGDLNNLEVLTEALRDGTVQGAKVVWLVSPNSTVNVAKIAKANNGDFVQGKEGDVVALRLEKAHDFAVAERVIATLKEALSYAFLLHSAIQRNGDRVTAEEIRFMAQELDQSLGGVYSLLSEEFQLPMARLFQARMEFKRKVPPLPAGLTDMAIVTGLDALGRGNDLMNLDTFLGGAGQIGGPEVLARYLNFGEYLKRRGAALGIDMNGLIKSDEEIAQADQQAQMMQMMQQGIGPAVNAMGGMAKEGMKQETEATTGEQ